jgi:glycosyltransferase involved in cell wall biosynthesis
VTFDGYNSHFREDFGFREDDILVIQPTRIVRRKRIEDSLELLRRLTDRFPELKERIHLIVSLYQGDEPDDNYMEEITQTAERNATPLHLISDRVASRRDETGDGKRIYTNRDVLVNGDLALYLPVWEGFGNALIEAIAAKVPVVTTTYLVYKTDIKVTGIENIEIRDVYDKHGKLVIQEKTLEEIRYILTHRREREPLIEKNFLIGKKEFGFQTLKEKIGTLLSEYGDEIRASRKRLARANTRYSV